MNLNFRIGFEKIAEEQSTLSKSLPYLAGGAVALGAYRLSRSPIGSLSRFAHNANKSGLARTVPYKSPKSSIGKFLDKLRFGADRVIYIPTTKKIPKKPLEVKESLIFDMGEHTKHIKGKYEVGSLRNNALRKIQDNKRKEMEVIKNLGKDFSPKSINPRNIKNISTLKKFHNKFKGNNYFVKPSGGAASGVGGEAFITGKDISKFLKKEPINKTKSKKIQEFLKKPLDYTAQQAMNIEKTFTGANKEFRVHAIGKNIMYGTGLPRTLNVGPVATLETGRAEKFLSKALKKLPKNLHGASIAADVAKTNKGYKIIELNMGSHASGFLDPNFMRSESRLFELESIIKNQQVYKKLTGRSGQLGALTSGAIAAPVAATATHYLLKNNHRN